MAALGAQTVASSYEQLLHTDTDGGGNDNTLVTIKDGDNGTTFGLKLATNKVEVIPGSDDANAFEVSQADGTAVFTVNSSTVGATLVGALSVTGDTTITSATSAKPELTIKNTNADASAPELVFIKDSSSPADNDEAGRIYMFADDDGGNQSEAFLAISKLTDVSNGSEDSNFDMYTLAGGTQKATLSLSSGSVGIGTTSPDNLLHIKTTGSTPSIELEQDAGTSYKGLIKLAGNDLEIRGSSGTIEFFTGNNDGDSSTERMRISSAGSIIPASAGTLNTHYGDGAGDAIQAGGNYNTLIGHDAGGAITTGDANVLMGDSAGDAITIGVNNCAIGNDALTAEDVGNNSTALGNAALASQNSDSNNELTENTGVGYAAGYYNVTGTGNTSVGFYSMVGASGNSHSDNTALGAYSGTAITGADSNVLIGYRAGDALTTGSNNVAMGKHALGNNTDVDNCVAIGSAALSQSNITSAADGAVGVGYFALGNLTTGARNTALGYYAMQTHTTGHSNIAIGYGAMDDTDSGSNALDSDDNIFIGYNAGGGTWANAKSETNVAIGNYSLAGSLNAAGTNTCVGYGTGENIVGGSSNVLMGHNAGNNIGSGSNNICVGYQAGTDTVALSTGDNNVVIGRNAHTSANSGANQIVIGQDVGGNADNSFCFGAASTDSAIAFGATSISAPSDVRMKRNIKDSGAGLSFINNLRPVTFEWKKEKDIPEELNSHIANSEKVYKNDKVNHGFIAQEVKECIDSHPEIKNGFDMWSKDDLDGRQRVAENALVPVLVKAVQELTAKVEELETKLNNKES